MRCFKTIDQYYINNIKNLQYSKFIHTHWGVVELYYTLYIDAI